jgi:hypothetical protein
MWYSAQYRPSISRFNSLSMRNSDPKFKHFSNPSKLKPLNILSLRVPFWILNMYSKSTRRSLLFRGGLQCQPFNRNKSSSNSHSSNYNSNRSITHSTNNREIGS